MSQLFQNRPRFLIEEGRPQTEEDVSFPQWNLRRYLREDGTANIRLWRPCAKQKSFEAGAVFCVRLCPAIPTFTQKEIDRMDLDRLPRFLPGRDASGLVTEGTLRCVFAIDNFGFDRKVSFIPSLPYVPADETYEKYSSPVGNPYGILTTTLWRKKGSLPETWAPLTMKTDEITAYRKSHRLYNRMHSQLMLPLPKKRYFGYGLIYKGYNIETEEDFNFQDRPYGLMPEDGLQLVTFNEQAFAEIQTALMLPSRPGSGDFYYPDPSAPDQGTLIYIWNREFPSPINPKAGKLNGFGYAGGVETRYFESSNKPFDVDLTLPESFLDFYSERRQPWSSVLRGTYGVEQVHMIAEIAPELKGPCKLAWQNHPLLMEAWEEAFQGISDDCDFFEVLHRLYGNDESGGEAAYRFQKRPSVGSSDFTQAEPAPPESEPLEEAAEPIAPTTIQTRSRVNTPQPPVAAPKTPIKSPLRAVGNQLFGTPAPLGFELDDQAQGERP